MTHIEFYDRNFADNFCSCLASLPERIIIVGDSNKHINKCKSIYEDIFNSRGLSVEVIPKSVGKNNISRIIEVFSEIVESYDNCVFDVTGGEDLYLVAVGMVCAKYPEKKIQVHRFNVENNEIYDCDQDGNATAKHIPLLSVAENVKIYGGEIIYSDRHKDGTYLWDLNPDFVGDIDIMWDICTKQPTWNKELTVLGFADQCSENEDKGCEIFCQINKLKAKVKKEGCEYIVRGNAVKALYNMGLITEYICTENTLKVVFKNEQIKRCLIKAGQVLEMKVLLYAKEATDRDSGEKLYNDAVNGVYIDWDGILGSNNGIDVNNEIDVMVMHGMIPVFVSCKNGGVENEELYKLNTVATRFGGKYARKVIVISKIDMELDKNKHLIQRAREMGIRPIVNFQAMNEDQKRAEIRNMLNRG